MLLKQGEPGQDGNSVVGPPGPPGPPGPVIAIPEVSVDVKPMLRSVTPLTEKRAKVVNTLEILLLTFRT